CGQGAATFVCESLSSGPRDQSAVSLARTAQTATFHLFARIRAAVTSVTTGFLIQPTETHNSWKFHGPYRFCRGQRQRRRARRVFRDRNARRGEGRGDTEIRWIFAFPFSCPRWDMRRMMLLGLLLLTGCQNTIGPLVNRQRGRPDDPYYSIEEQKRFGRD